MQTIQGSTQVSDVVKAAGKVGDAVEELAEAAEKADDEAKNAAVPPEPPQAEDHGRDLDLGERLGRLEEAQKQPAQDPRVDGLLGKFDEVLGKLGEALSDSVADVEEIAAPEESPIAPVVEQVEQAPKRVHGFLKRLW